MSQIPYLVWLYNTFNSLASMLPDPSASKRSNASLISCFCSSVSSFLGAEGGGHKHEQSLTDTIWHAETRCTDLYLVFSWQQNWVAFCTPVQELTKNQVTNTNMPNVPLRSKERDRAKLRHSTVGESGAVLQTESRWALNRKKAPPPLFYTCAIYSTYFIRSHDTSRSAQKSVEETRVPSIFLPLSRSPSFTSTNVKLSSF